MLSDEEIRAIDRRQDFHSYARAIESAVLAKQAQASTGQSGEVAWLIERGPNEGHSPHVWLKCDLNGVGTDKEKWVTDSNKATKFATLNDAHDYVEEKHGGMKWAHAITEHSWIDATPPQSGEVEGLLREADEYVKEIISHEEAEQILMRFNSSHFGNTSEKARYSIPADPTRDDDLRLHAYIKQNRLAAALRAQWAVEPVAWLKKDGVGMWQLAWDGGNTHGAIPVYAHPVSQPPDPIPKDICIRLRDTPFGSEEWKSVYREAYQHIYAIANAPPAHPGQQSPPTVPTYEQIVQAVARGWCHKANEKKVTDPALAFAIANEVFKLFEAAAPPPAGEK